MIPVTSKEVVRKSLYFETPERYARDFPEPFGSDFRTVSSAPHPDDRLSKGVDSWGCVWNSIGAVTLGEVADFPLKVWDDLPRLRIPDVENESIWENVKGAREAAGDRYLLGNGVSIYERLHFLRGLENTWCDIHEEPENLCALIDILTELNIKMIRRYGRYGADGLIFCDDWGLQNRLMIDPADWRRLWKPAYKRIFDAAHAEGMDTFLHSCGYIIDILDDLIEIGLNAIHMDQQENMGLENLSRFRGRLTFFAPVDIQKTMATGTPAEIRAYCRKMARCLGKREGGFIPRWYADPVGAGHTRANIDAMCREFLTISEEMYGK